MSNHDKIAKLKEYIKNVVIKELEKDEELEEVSTTATAGIDGTGTGHYDTPHAFSSGSAVGHKSPEVGGYKKVNESFVSSGKVSDVFLKLKSKGFGNKKFGDISKELSKYYKTPGLADVMASMFKEIWMKGNKKEAEKEVLDWLKTVAKKSKLESVNEKLSVDPRKVYGGTGAKQGMVLTAQKGLKKILDLSKKNPSNVFLVSDDNYTNFGPYYVKNGKVAKYTVANPNYDLQKNKVRSLKVPSDVILKFTINESINESYARMFIEIGKAINASKADDLNAIKDLGEEYDIGRVLYMARTNPKALKKAVDDRVKEKKQFLTKTKKLKELKEGRYHDWRNDESLSPKQKIGNSMREIRDALNELDKTVKMNLKLKTELKMKSEDYWKNTHKALTKISERLVKMANKIGNLK